MTENTGLGTALDLSHTNDWQHWQCSGQSVSDEVLALAGLLDKSRLGLGEMATLISV